MSGIIRDQPAFDEAREAAYDACIMISFSRLLAGSSLALALLVTPSHAHAATSQQLLNQALMSSSTHMLNVANGTIDVSTTKTALRKDETSERSGGQFRISFERPLNGTDFQASIELAKYFATAAEEKLASTLNPAPTVWIRSLNQQIFLRLGNLASLFSTFNVGLFSDASQFSSFEQWLRMDLSANDESSLPVTLSVDPASLASFETELLTNLRLAANKKVSPLLVISTERVKNAPTQQHLRVRVNPAFITLMQTEALKQAGRDATKQKEVKERFQSLRAGLQNLHLAVVIDTSKINDPTLTRLELNGTQTETERGCVYVRTLRNGDPDLRSLSCNVARLRVKNMVAGALNFSSRPTVSIEAPANSVSLKDTLETFFQGLLNEFTSSSSLEIDDSTSSSMSL